MTGFKSKLQGCSSAENKFGELGLHGYEPSVSIIVWTHQAKVWSGIWWQAKIISSLLGQGSHVLCQPLWKREFRDLSKMLPPHSDTATPPALVPGLCLDSGSSFSLKENSSIGFPEPDNISPHTHTHMHVWSSELLQYLLYLKHFSF
jgi:hypothetical protein